MKDQTAAPDIKIWRLPRLGDVELLRATHLKQSFPRHTHEHYAVGVIEQGALGFFYRGENIVARPGNINLCIPGEVHTGHPAAENGWTYRMFYFDPGILQAVATDLTDRPRGVPFFKTGTIDDVVLARQLRRLHIQLEPPDPPLLEQECALLDVLAQLILRHADDSPTLYRAKREPHVVCRLKRFIERHYADDMSLDDLSHHVHLSRYHLLRVFRDIVGVPPHAYLRQVRIKHAKALLACGQPIADVAVATGFTDQSHLSRWLKRLWGFTPGQYRNSVQDGFA